ncbi:MAG: hypothetical protein Q4G30_01510 [Actinomycetaceae bacterium]|nr:hypothetical protein [Actinomycetaceae bacterium]
MKKSHMPRIALALLASAALTFTAACGGGKDKGEESASPSESKSVEATQSEEPTEEAPKAKGEVIDASECSGPLGIASVCVFTNPKDVPVKMSIIYGFYNAAGEDISDHSREADAYAMTVAPGQTFPWIVHEEILLDNPDHVVAAIKHQAVIEETPDAPVWDGTIELGPVEGWTGGTDSELKTTITVRPTDPGAEGSHMVAFVVCKNDAGYAAVSSDGGTYLMREPEYVSDNAMFFIDRTKEGQAQPTCEAYGVLQAK